VSGTLKSSGSRSTHLLPGKISQKSALQSYFMVNLVAGRLLKISTCYLSLAVHWPCVSEFVWLDGKEGGRGGGISDFDCMHTYVYMCVHSECEHMITLSACTYVYTNTYMYIHAYTYIYIYIYMQIPIHI